MRTQVGMIVRELRETFPKLTQYEAGELVHLMTSADSPKNVDEVLEAANKLLGGHGVESVRDENSYVNKFYHDTVLLYVNMGDPYVATLLYDTVNREFTIGSWGDFVEKLEYERRPLHDDEIEMEGSKKGKYKVGATSPRPWTMEYKQFKDDSGYAPARSVTWRDADGNPVGITMQGRIDDTRGNADALLITAAPDLLRALEILVDVINVRGELDPLKVFSSIEIARGAIEKAHGK